MTPAAFIQEISGAGRRPLYLISGGEPSALSRCLKAAEEAVDAGFRDFNHQILELEKGQAGRLRSEAGTMPFFVPPRVIVTKNPAFDGDDWNLMADYLDDPNPETTIIIVLDKPDARLRFFKKVKKDDLEVDCTPPKGQALSKWLVDEFKNRGVSINSAVASIIIERTGVDLKKTSANDLNVLAGEAEKLSLYVGAGNSVDAALAREMVSLAPNADVFELGDALGRCDAKAALASILDLLATENHMPVLAMMVRHFRLLLQVKTRQASLGLSRLGREDAAELGLHPFVLEKTQAQTSGWSFQALTEALAALEDAHRTLVTTSSPPEMILEALVLKLTSPAR